MIDPTLLMVVGAAMTLASIGGAIVGWRLARLSAHLDSDRDHSR